MATIQGRVTPPEHVVFQRILAERKAKGLNGFENATEWIRAVLHEQAVALGVPLPAEYHDVRSVRALNWERTEAPLSAEAEENCHTPDCPNAIGECGVFCDRCVDEILAKPPHAARRRARRPGSFTEEAVLAAWESSGRRVGKVAEKFGVSYDAAHRWLKSFGVKFRHRGRPSLLSDPLEKQ